MLSHTESAAPASITLDVLTTLEALEALRPEWESLWSLCPWATPFQHPAWMIAWCRHFAAEKRVLCMRDRGRLVGILPLSIYTEGERRLVGLLGGGVSDYLDALFDPACVLAGVELAHEYLCATRSAWDECRFEQLRPCSPLLSLRIPGTRGEQEVQEVCPLLRLPGCADDLAHVASAALLRDARYRRRLAQRRGQFAVHSARAEEVPDFLQELERLHGARWAARHQAGMLADSAVRAFHAEAARGMAAAGLLRLTALRLDGSAFASCHALVLRGRVYCYLTGFDPAFAQLSPGKLLMLTAIEHAIEARDEVFDFLRGSEPYKYSWGAVNESIYRVRLMHGEELQA